MWMECWDAEKEKVFYFHRLTGIKRNEPPEEFAKEGGGKNNKQGLTIDTTPAADDPAVVFRTKRYRLLRQVYKEHGDTSAMRSGTSPVRPSRTTYSPLLRAL